MGFFEELKKSLSLPSRQTDKIEEKKREIQRIDNELLEPRDEFDEETLKEIERKLSNMKHHPRMNLVWTGAIHHDTWHEISAYISDNEKLRKKWGLEGVHIDTTEFVCRNHDTPAPVKTLRIPEESNKQRTYSRTRSQQADGEVGASSLVSAKARGSKTKTNSTSSTQGTKFGRECKFYECGTGDKDCKLNRRVFIRVGDHRMSNDTNKLNVAFENAATESKEAKDQASDAGGENQASGSEEVDDEID